MQYLRIRETPRDEAQVLVMALAGWADAGEAATAALRFLARKFGAIRFAELDPEEFYDFSQTRPYSSITREGLRRVRWPANEILICPANHDRPALMLFLGVEPNLKWRTYSNAILDLAHRYGVRHTVHIGALLDAVPHTRPVLLTGGSNKVDINKTLEDMDIRRSRYQGPTGITAALVEGCTQRGISFASMWGHAPHYLHAAPNYTVSHALLQQLSSFLKMMVPLQDLAEASQFYRSQVESAVEQDSQLMAYVDKLQERYDSVENPLDGFKEMPRTEEVLRELEDFLKDRQHRPWSNES